MSIDFVGGHDLSNDDELILKPTCYERGAKDDSLSILLRSQKMSALVYHN